MFQIGKKQENVGTKVPNSPPGLFFRHAGHRYKSSVFRKSFCTLHFLKCFYLQNRSDLIIGLSFASAMLRIGSYLHVLLFLRTICYCNLRILFYGKIHLGTRLLISIGTRATHGRLLVYLMMVKVLVAVVRCRYQVVLFLFFDINNWL